MTRLKACGSMEHVLARRQFLGSLAGAGVVGGLGVFAQPAIAKKLQSEQKRVVVINMAGGLSQLESWDPKPGVETGGPFRAIPTSVPGIHISELLPHTAKQMHNLAIVRSINTKENDHGKGRYMMFTGRRQSPALSFPEIGAVAFLPNAGLMISGGLDRNLSFQIRTSFGKLAAPAPESGMRDIHDPKT